MAAIFETLADKKLIDLIKNGAVGIIPTDTVYGIVCQATNKQAVKRLYGLKGRRQKPGTIIAGNLDQLVSLGIKRAYVKAVEQLWPGPISIVIPNTDASTAYLRQNVTGLAVRLPKDSKLQTLLSHTGALLTTSANPLRKDPAAIIEQAAIYFGDKVDFYVDNGNLSKRLPSTVIRIVDDEIEVLREGAVVVKNNKVISR